MRRIILFIGFLMFGFLGVNGEEISGRIEGRVIDKETMNSLSLVNIIIKGTSLGTATDTNGRYSILDVPVGTYKISVSMLGYKKIIKDAKVLAGQTVRVNFELQSTPVMMQGMVVTATKTERLIRDVPASVTLITSKDIERTSARWIDDMLRDIAGVEVRRARGISSPCTHVRLRGFPHPRATLIMRDGIPTNRIACGGMKWNEIPAELVKRVEVVRGAASSIYGSSAMGGVINIITKKPEEKIGVKIGYGTNTTWNGGINISGYLTERLGYFLYYNHLHTDGYEVWDYDAIRENMFNMGADSATVEGNLTNWKTYARDQYRYCDNGFGKLTYNVTPSSELSLAYSYYDDNLGNGREYTCWNFKRNRIMLGYKQRIANLTLSGGASYLDEDFTITFDNRPFFDTIGMISNMPGEDYGGVMNISLPFGEKHLVTFGGDFRSGLMEKDDEIKKVEHGMPIHPGRLHAKGRQQRASSFIQDEWEVGKLGPGKLLATLSARYDWYKTYDGSLYEHVFEVFASGDTFHISEIDTSYASKTHGIFNPKLGLVYHLTDFTTLRGSVGKGFDAPYLYSLYGTFECPPGKRRIGNPEIGPEYAISYELGMEQRLGDKFTSRLTGFYNDIYDWMDIIDTTGLGEEFVWQNIDRVQTRGIEIEAEYNPFTSLRLYANYSYLLTEVVEYKDYPEYEGNWLTDQPRNRVNFGFIYHNPDVLTFTLRQNYMSSRFDELENTHLMDGYITWDIKVSKKREFMEVSFEIDNITDKKYHDAWNWKIPGRTIMSKVNLIF